MTLHISDDGNGEVKYQIRDIIVCVIVALDHSCLPLLDVTRLVPLFQHMWIIFLTWTDTKVPQTQHINLKYLYNEFSEYNQRFNAHV